MVVIIFLVLLNLCVVLCIIDGLVYIVLCGLVVLVVMLLVVIVSR